MPWHEPWRGWSVPVVIRPPRAGFRQRRPSLSKEGSYLGTSFTDIALYSGPGARCGQLTIRLLPLLNR